MRRLPSLRPRDRRALLIGAILLAPALGWRLIGHPYARARATLRARLEEQRGLLAREVSLVAGAQRLPGALSLAAAAAGRARTLLLAGRDPLAASAGLVTLVGDDARRDGVLLETIEPQTPDSLPTSAGLVAVRLVVRGRGDLEGLLRWLHALESDPRLLRVERLTLARFETGAAPDSLDVETLSVAAEIRGFVLVGGRP